MARKRARRSSRARAARPRRRRLLAKLTLYIALLGIVAVVAYGVWLDLSVRSRFEGQRWQVPAHIYARALELYPGASVSLDDTLAELTRAGYHASDSLERPASYRKRAGMLEIHTRSFRFWDSTEPARRLRLRFQGDTVASIEEGGREAALARLEPVLIGRIQPGQQQDRVLVRLAEVPETLVAALIAIEDHSFFEHGGISLRGMARALLANLRAGATVQGGSTLTQQLAKSYFLSAQRTLWRKLNDMAIALVLEARYSKNEILEAYINEVYLGQDGPRAIHGFALGARHYFGRRLDELSLPETALLAGLVKGPSLYNPRRHPERARQRRDLVIDQMAALAMIEPALAARAKAQPLGVPATPGAAGSDYPGFLDLVRRRLRDEYREDDLRSDGLQVFTTLDPGVQDAAQEALSRVLTRLEQSPRQQSGSLQGAVVVSEPQSGEVLAVVSGRDPRAPGFNRALDAHRPIGSLVKPAIYLAALTRPERYSLATLLDDAPVSVPGSNGQVWEPGNYDGEIHGPVALIDALAQSYNLATVQLGLALGLDAVRDTLARMGVSRPVHSYPSLLLGTLDLSPMEVTAMYQTIASGGFRQPLRVIREVIDAQGQSLGRYGLSVESALDPRATFLLTRGMQEVIRSGTGRAAAQVLPAGLAAAGKTGTTDDLRDSWFAGFAGDRLAVAWIGRDDNRSAHLTGASGALRIWIELFRRIRPRPLVVAPPDGIAWGRADLNRGVMLDESCDPDTLPVLPYIVSQDVARCLDVTAPAAAPAAPAWPHAPRSWIERKAQEAQ
jgi:penicillin-binding protein 1B